MKIKLKQVGLSLISPPSETRRDTVNERRSAADRNNLVGHWTYGVVGRDPHPSQAAGGAPQRVRARQTEPRTAEHCHARTLRRAPAHIG
ncbi:MAG: hypothetical protein WCI28_03885 [Opitutaceae bacterium]